MFFSCDLFQGYKNKKNYKNWLRMAGTIRRQIKGVFKSFVKKQKLLNVTCIDIHREKQIEFKIREF